MADKTKGLSLRDRIRECDDITRELVKVPEWNCAIEMRSPTAAEGYALEEWYLAAKGSDDDKTPNPAKFRGMKERYISCCAYDPDTGKQLFGEEDIEWLQEKSSNVIEGLWNVASRLTGLTEDEAEKLGKSLESGEAKGSGST